MTKGFFKIELKIISTYAKFFEKSNISYPQYTSIYEYRSKKCYFSGNSAYALNGWSPNYCWHDTYLEAWLQSIISSDCETYLKRCISHLEHSFSL